MPNVNTARLVQFSSKLDSKLADAGIQFAARRKDGTYGDDNSGMKTAAGVAGAGALAAGGIYARGRVAQTKALRPGYAVDNSLSGVAGTFAAGGRALKGDVRNAATQAGNIAARTGKKLNVSGRNVGAAAARSLRTQGPTGRSMAKKIIASYK
jgi:hypothetical protein